MRVQRLKYQRSVRSKDGHESLEVTIDLEPQEFEEEAFQRAKTFVEKKLQIRGLSATIGERIAKMPTCGEDPEARKTKPIPPASYW